MHFCKQILFPDKPKVDENQGTDLTALWVTLGVLGVISIPAVAFYISYRHYANFEYNQLAVDNRFR